MQCPMIGENCEDDMQILKKSKILVSILVGTLTALIIYFSAPMSRLIFDGPGQTRQASIPDFDSSPAHFILAREDFWIPQYYLLWPQEQLREPPLIDIYANWPDMTPQVEEKSNLAIARANIDNSLTIVISDKTLLPTKGPNFLEARRQISDKVYGGPFVESGLTAHGLKRFKTSRNNERGMYTEMYEERIDGHLSSYILCSEFTKNPTCASFQEIGGFIVTIRFDKSHLSAWKEIQRKSNDLLESFKSKD